MYSFVNKDLGKKHVQKVERGSNLDAIFTPDWGIIAPDAPSRVLTSVLVTKCLGIFDFSGKFEETGR